MSTETAEAVTPTCAECGRPFDPTGSETIAGKTVCKPCLAAIRARVAADLAANQRAVPTPADYDVYTAPSGRSRRAKGKWSGNSGEGTLSDLLMGIALGCAVGMAGAFIYDKFVFYTHIQFGLISSFIGFAVGITVVAGGRRSGLLPAVLGGGITFICMVLSYLLLANDQLEAANKNVQIPFDPSGFLFTVTHLEVMDWVFIAIGVYAAVQVPLRR